MKTKAIVLNDKHLIVVGLVMYAEKRMVTINGTQDYGIKVIIDGIGEEYVSYKDDQFKRDNEFFNLGEAIASE